VRNLRRLRKASESRFSNEKDTFLLYNFGIGNLEKNTVFSKTNSLNPANNSSPYTTDHGGNLSRQSSKESPDSPSSADKETSDIYKDKKKKKDRSSEEDSKLPFYKSKQNITIIILLILLGIAIAILVFGKKWGFFGSTNSTEDSRDRDLKNLDESSRLRDSYGNLISIGSQAPNAYPTSPFTTRLAVSLFRLIHARTWEHIYQVRSLLYLNVDGSFDLAHLQAAWFHGCVRARELIEDLETEDKTNWEEYQVHSQPREGYKDNWLWLCLSTFIITL